MAAVLEAQNESLERRYRLAAQGFDMAKVIKRAAEISGLAPELIRNPGKEPLRVQARSLVCYWAVRELGLNDGGGFKNAGHMPDGGEQSGLSRQITGAPPRDQAGCVSYKFSPV